jgi:isochorismate synthase
MTDLFLKIKVQQEQNLPFVVFCKPNTEQIVGLFQSNDHLYFIEDFEEKGFVFAPFEDVKKPFIPLEFADVYVEKKAKTTFYFDKNPTVDNENYGKDYFEEIVQSAIESINANEFQKVVLSRKETVISTSFDAVDCFRKMLFLYPNAFCYYFYHPKIGTWLGASPEQFLKTNGLTLKTVALAGTQLLEGNKKPDWQKKEVHEQELVTKFIIDSIENLVKEVSISMPYSMKAGNLWHIKTDIEAKMKSKNQLLKIIESLHPTSAVCGLPKESAKQFILKNEGYNREYYCGFLGELNIELSTFKTKQSDLFVNLRCMKVLKNAIDIYIGCGITMDSIPEKEYNETANKSLTMKRCIN